MRHDYDFIFIDSPPSLGLLTLNALVAADAVLDPAALRVLRARRHRGPGRHAAPRAGALNPGLDIEGVLLTMYDERTNLGQQVARDIREFFQEKVFQTVIPRNVRLGEAPSHGLPVILYDAQVARRRGVLALARELLARERTAAVCAEERDSSRISTIRRGPRLLPPATSESE